MSRRAKWDSLPGPGELNGIVYQVQGAKWDSLPGPGELNGIVCFVQESINGIVYLDQES